MTDIHIAGLVKRYGDHAAIDRLDLDVPSGEFLTLLGPSGCGKTTTLRSLAGLVRPDAGTISFAGTPVSQPERGIFTAPNRREVGFVFQSYALWPHMSVGQNVAYPLKVRRRPRAEIAKAVADALELVDLSGYERRSATDLSGGQQQRVALARALVTRPRLLLFDEPLSNLDAELRTQLRPKLREVHRELGTTSVYVTHDQEDALRLSDRVAVMRGGRIEQLDTPQDLFANPRSAFVARFVGFDHVVQAKVLGSSAGEYRLAPEGWEGELRARAPEGTVVGSSVLLAVRSREVRVDAAGQAANDVRGVIEDVTFAGSVLELRIRVGRERLERVPGPLELVGAIGQTVRLTVRPEHVVILDDAPDGAPSETAVRSAEDRAAVA